MAKHRLYSFLILFLLFPPATFPIPLTPFESHHYKFVRVKELSERLKQGQNITVVDVRSAYAYQMEHIPGSLSIPLANLKNQVTANPLPRSGIVVTYCSCPRHEAEMAADLLSNMDYHNVFVLQEGLPGWKKAGYKTTGELANQPVTPYWVVGYAWDFKHKPKAGVVVRVLQPQTQQLEIGTTNKHGFYALELLFYGLRPGQQMQVIIGSDVIFYSLGNRSNPWGTRIDDHDGRISPVPKLFLKTFKEQKLRAE